MAREDAVKTRDSSPLSGDFPPLRWPRALSLESPTFWGEPAEEPRPPALLWPLPPRVLWLQGRRVPAGLPGVEQSATAPRCRWGMKGACFCCSKSDNFYIKQRARVAFQRRGKKKNQTQLL